MLEMWKKAGWEHTDLHGANVMIQFAPANYGMSVPIAARAIDVGASEKGQSRESSKEVLLHLKDGVKHQIKKKMGLELALKF